MSKDNSGPANFASVDEQSGKINKKTEKRKSKSTIDRFVDDEISDSTQNVRGNDPDQYDLSHPLAREWIAKRHDLRWSDSTVSNYQSQVRVFLSYLEEKDVSLLNATFTELLEFVEYRVQAEAARQTVTGQCCALKDLYQYIKVRTDSEPEIEPYEFDELNFNSYNYKGGFERGDITSEEVYLLFQNFKRPRDYLMAYFAVATGARNSDIRTLRLEDIDYDELEIYIPNPKNSRPYSIPVSRELASKLKKWERTGREGYATAESSKYVFPSKQGDLIKSSSSFNTIVVQAAKRAGIQEIIGTRVRIDSQDLRNEQRQEIYRVTVHTLRHTCLTMLKKAGVPPEARRKMANHKDIETTEDYTHDDDDDDWRDLTRDLLDF